MASKAYCNISIDGKPDEPDWANAEAVSDFFRVETVQDGEIKKPITARILYDDQHIYFEVVCYDSLGK